MKTFRVSDIMDSTTGVCLACGTETSGVEPDAENYLCAHCGQRQVFGLEQAFLMGSIQVDFASDDPENSF